MIKRFRFAIRGLGWLFEYSISTEEQAVPAPAANVAALTEQVADLRKDMTNLSIVAGLRPPKKE